MKPPFSEATKKEALKMGIDLDDDKVQQQLLDFHAQKKQQGQTTPAGVRLRRCAATTTGAARLTHDMKGHGALLPCR